MSVERRGNKPGEAKYGFGDRVIIKGSCAGIVLYGYNMYMEGHKPLFIYRVLIDANDLVYRCINNSADQEGCIDQIKDDLHQLITDTKHVAVVEIEEIGLQDIPQEQMATLGSDQDGSGRGDVIRQESEGVE